MDEQGLNNLLALGFTYEDLYKRGLLVIKPKETAQETAQTAQETAQPAQTAQETAQPAQTAQEPAQAAQTAQEPAQAAQTAEYAKMWKAFDYFKQEITKMIQGANTQNATRTDSENTQMTVTAAIHGLYKGDK